MNLTGQAQLRRGPSMPCGTFGTLTAHFGLTSFVCATLELPWRDNRRNVSCIPAGTYSCWPVTSPSKGLCYQVHNVPGRGSILIHPGNWAGDRALGMRTDSEGCILLGTTTGQLDGQDALLRSAAVVRAFEAFFGGEEFELAVTDFKPEKEGPAA